MSQSSLRTPGYYWLDIKGDNRRVAEWTGDTWLLTGQVEALDPRRITAVGRQIPHETSHPPTGRRYRDTQGRPVAVVVPSTLSNEQAANACLSYRHDFGLMSSDQQRRLLSECREWYVQILKNLPEPR